MGSCGETRESCQSSCAWRVGEVMTPEQLKSLRYRAHLHEDRCYGRYEPCGEHHAHDERCGDRPLTCGRREDHELLALLQAYDQSQLNLASAVKGLDELAASVSKFLKSSPPSAAVSPFPKV